jgi:Holliday junction resolvasome RuvABC endonuclease subunit
MPTTVVGIDSSLTKTGLAMLRTHGVDLVTALTSSGKKDDDLRTRFKRLDWLGSHILTFCTQPQVADLVVIEGPSMASKFGHPHDRSGLWWLIVHSLWRHQVPVMEVSPSVRMKYATGKGQADKDAVLTSVVRRYPGYEVKDNNEADALVLAAIGMRMLGEPIEESLPQTHLDALRKLVLP